MFASTYILERIEEGFTNYLSNSSLSASIQNYYQFQNSTANKESPCIVVQSNFAQEDFFGSGIYHCDTRITFVYPFEDTGSLLTDKNTAYSIFSEVLFNNTSSLFSDITGSTSNLYIYDIFGNGINNRIEENHFISEVSFDVVAGYTD